MDTDRPALTPDDCHALREFSGMTWCVRGRWVSLGEILDSWVDATMRAQYSASARADALAARVAELEAELSATERTADAERERAKRAERLLESESARVAELEAENERLRDIGEDMCINMGAFIGAHECPSQEVIRRWDTATGQDNAGSNLRAYSADCAEPAPNSAEPTTRPLTTADRLPEVGDVLVCPVGGTLACVQAGTEYKFVVNDDLDGYVWRDSNHLQHTRPHEYISRADGGPVVMGGADGG